MINGVLHAREFRRCLIEADVAGIMAVWKHTAPHLAKSDPAQALLALHMARCDAKYMPRNLKDWSVAFLADHGIQKIDGQWTAGLPKPKPVFEAVGISSRGLGGIRRPINQKIEVYMEDALLNARAKGVTEAPMQREAMLKARSKVRFKARMA